MEPAIDAAQPSLVQSQVPRLRCLATFPFAGRSREHDAPPLSHRQTIEQRQRLRNSSDAVAYPRGDSSRQQFIPTGLPRRELFQERRRNVAAVRRSKAGKAELGRQGLVERSIRERLRGFCHRGAKASKKTGKKCHLWRSTGLISCVARLTIREGEDYIHPLGRAAAGRDGASAKPLTVHTVTDHPAIQSWPCSRRRVGCAGFGTPASAGVFPTSDGAARFRDV
jgi:hypothetical protein